MNTKWTGNYRSKTFLSISIQLLAVMVLMIFAPSAFGQRPVMRKGVTLVGDMSQYTVNNYAELQRILDTGAGVIGVNLPWYQITAGPQKPSHPRMWNDPVYENSSILQYVDELSGYVKLHGNGAMVMAITYGTPTWAACSADLTSPQQPFIPALNAADYGDFMYAMSERYNGKHVDGHGAVIGSIRDWVVYNEVNSPTWWGNTACNRSHLDPVHYYDKSLNQAYSNVHHVPGDRVLAGGLTSYGHIDDKGAPGLRITNSYMDWAANTANRNVKAAWIGPIGFVEAMHKDGAHFDAVSLHPYAATIDGDQLETPPDGAVTLANVGVLTARLRSLYPNGRNKQWHVALTEYMQQSYYGSKSAGWDHVSKMPCPDYFCDQTIEAKLAAQLQEAYGASGSGRAADTPYVDYLEWTMWKNTGPYTGGILRADGSDKNEGMGTGSVRAAFTAVAP